MLPRQGYKAIPWQNETEVGRNMPRQAEKWAEFLLRHWLLVLGSGNFVLNDLNDDFVVVPGEFWAGNMPRQELGQGGQC
ncbi:hypothetical protein V6N13_008062 [Hibiscus sabdariffa]